jgi:mono/diheme cytochrome c family protein
MKFSKTICISLLLAGAGAAYTTVAFSQSASAPAAGGKLYTVVDGYKVDPDTLQGFRTWRAAACDRCHGANQEGLVGPSLIEGLKHLSKDDFVKTVMNGRPNTQMVAFSGNKTVTDNIDKLYAYLKGRSDGAITKAHVEAMQ